MNCSTPGLPVHHQLLESTQTHVHWVSDAIQPSHLLLNPSPPAPNPSQHQGLFQWVNSSHEVAKELEFQLQHQSFQWTHRPNLLKDGLFGSPCSPRDSQESFQHHSYIVSTLFKLLKIIWGEILGNDVENIYFIFIILDSFLTLLVHSWTNVVDFEWFMDVTKCQIDF